MPFVKGMRKVGGRKKGSINVASRTVQETLDRLGVNPFEGMAQIATGKIPCGACHGKGKTKVKAADGSFYDRTCESCYGSLLEKVSPETRAKMYAELGRYIQPQRKAIEHTGADGAPLDNRMEVVFVKAVEGKREG